MRVKVKFFAAPREAMGRGEIEQDVPPGSTVDELMGLLTAEYPVLVAEVSSHSMGEFGSTLGGGMLVSDVVTFVFLRGTGRLADVTGDYRLALSAGACGFIAFGLIAAIAGIGRRQRPAR